MFGTITIVGEDRKKLVFHEWTPHKVHEFKALSGGIFKRYMQIQPCHQHFHCSQEDLGKSTDQIRLALAGAATEKFISRRPFLIFPCTIGKNSFESSFSDNLPFRKKAFPSIFAISTLLVSHRRKCLVCHQCLQCTYTHQLLIYHSLGFY